MGERAEHPSLGTYLEQSLAPRERSRIGILSFNHWSFAVGTIMETVVEARALGSHVVVGFWADETPLPDVGWRASRFIARILGSRTRDQQAQTALEAWGVPASTFVDPPISHWQPTALPALPKPSTRAAVRGLRYRDSLMGPAILEMPPGSGMPVADGHEWPRRWVRTAMRSYAWAYDQARALIREQNLGTVVVYNGRFTHDRAVAAAAAAEGVRTLYYDTGGYETDFDLTQATTHDWAHLQGRMQAMYNSWDPGERETLGARWFMDRRAHIDEHNRRFTEVQETGNLDGLPASTRRVVFFSSSGDEIAELDLDWSQYLNSQEYALTRLADECRKRPGTTLIVRTHPHMRLKPIRDQREWEAAVHRAAPDVHFDPSSKVDSYALMEVADVVFTYGSTAGVEAAFFGRPVVVMGPSAYDLLGCARRITSAAEIGQCLDVPPDPRPEAALAYGLMMQRRGFNYVHARKLPDDALGLGDCVIGEASEATRKASDAWIKARTWWLTRR